jgi:ribosomal protein S17E
MNILVCGDSFAADWSVKYQNYLSWVSLLSKKYSITNRAQAGCSEYKIYNQIINEDLTKYNCVIVSHTSPYRIPVEHHPILRYDVLHKDADLIYSDIKDKNNPELSGIIDFFENYFHTEYAKFVHQLIIKEQQKYLNKVPTLHLSYYKFELLDTLTDNLCFRNIFEKNKGLINHMSESGNIKLANQIDQWITKYLNENYNQRSK